MNNAATDINEWRLSHSSPQERAIARLLLDISIGATTTVHGIAVTRWSLEMWEVGTWGVCSEKISEAAMSLLDLRAS